MAEPVVYTLGRLIVDLYAGDMGVPLRDVSIFHKYLGGSAANTAVGLARLGAPVGMISRVGPDDFGRFLLGRLKDEGVDTEMVKVDPVYPTGLAFAALFPPGDSEVLFYRKPCADANIALQDIMTERFSGPRFLVVACTALAVSPGREATLATLELNRAGGGTNILDLDWRPQFWSSCEEALLYYGLALRLADVVLANESELEFAGRSNDPDLAAHHLFRFGVQQVVAKRGGAGCLYYGPDGELHIPPYHVQVQNTLGAGDGFGAAYTYGLLHGWEAERRLKFAAAAGAIVVSRHSCSESMPTRNEIETLLRQ